ncbi:MAG TPA: TetR/AcrR family transcriptional regulator [Longimicrobium sp.]|nr:TetR/AcrR family transcriptional regulator [Longimicrobium sp.]
MTEPAAPARTARQPRSRRTEERILTAFGELLRGARFDELSVQQVAGRAGVSVGGFYARFASKDDLLLHALYAGYVRDAVAEAERVLDPARWADAGIAPIAEAYFDLMLRMARAHLPVLRELVHRTRGNPEAVAGSAAWAAFRQGVHEPFRRLLAERMDEVNHPDPPFALRFGFSACSSALRESELFGHMEPAMGPVDEAVMARELARLLCGYLGVPFPGGDAPAVPPSDRETSP